MLDRQTSVLHDEFTLFLSSVPTTGCYYSKEHSCIGRLAFCVQLKPKNYGLSLDS